MILVNFAHPLDQDQRAAAERLAGRPIERCLELPAHFDNQLGFLEQARALVESAGLAPEEWETAPLLVNLPSLAPIAALVLAEIHGRRGHFPAVLRLRPLAEGPFQRFEVAEILNLHTVREAARERRAAPAGGSGLVL